MTWGWMWTHSEETLFKCCVIENNIDTNLQQKKKKKVKTQLYLSYMSDGAEDTLNIMLPIDLGCIFSFMLVVKVILSFTHF